MGQCIQGYLYITSYTVYESIIISKKNSIKKKKKVLCLILKLHDRNADQPSSLTQELNLPPITKRPDLWYHGNTVSCSAPRYHPCQNPGTHSPSCHECGLLTAHSSIYPSPGIILSVTKLPCPRSVPLPSSILQPVFSPCTSTKAWPLRSVQDTSEGQNSLWDQLRPHSTGSYFNFSLCLILPP